MFIGNYKSFPGQTINWENTFQPDQTPKTIILYYKLLEQELILKFLFYTS